MKMLHWPSLDVFVESLNTASGYGFNKKWPMKQFCVFPFVIRNGLAMMMSVVTSLTKLGDLHGHSLRSQTFSAVAKAHALKIFINIGSICTSMTVNCITKTKPTLQYYVVHGFLVRPPLGKNPEDGFSHPEPLSMLPVNAPLDI